ncbi:hypothetical protein FOZ60_013721 [Perkinsus olseni]|uniref:Uncharacterized protein n=1 Tax=Perkinsus olseni TaxID=32597 RepID=A0A7J6P861_PEROL|nr:hypothetical protein FOZ60_013721 [Perkinsus olseni]
MAVVRPPYYPDQVQAFNTDRFTEEVIRNVTQAGVDINTLVMTIPLLARSTYDSSDVGYSNAIYDLGGDPKGDGSVIYSPGDGFYFFSQPRAIDKIAVAKKHGLGGIALQENLKSDELSSDSIPRCQLPAAFYPADPAETCMYPDCKDPGNTLLEQYRYAIVRALKESV